jgi:hypothetical protein
VSLRSVNNALISYVKLAEIDQRSLSQDAMMQQARVLLKNYPGDIHFSVGALPVLGGNQTNADV